MWLQKSRAHMFKPLYMVLLHLPTCHWFVDFGGATENHEEGAAKSSFMLSKLVKLIFLLCFFAAGPDTDNGFISLIETVVSWPLCFYNFVG